MAWWLFVEIFVGEFKGREMTCIVGLVHDGKVYMGGDSCASNGHLSYVRKDVKVFIRGPFIFGFTTSFRMGQLLQYSLAEPLHDPAISDHQYMTTTFIDAVRNCLKTGGYASATNGTEAGGIFLVGYKGQLYRVDDDYQVGNKTGRTPSITSIPPTWRLLVLHRTPTASLRCLRRIMAG